MGGLLRHYSEVAQPTALVYYCCVVPPVTSLSFAKMPMKNTTVAMIASDGISKPSTAFTT